MSSRVCKIFAVLIVTALSNGAKAQDITMQGVARSFSANYFMRTACPRYFKLDQSAAAMIGEAALMFGNDSFGADMMKPLVVKELERRRFEVKATGESAWCS